MNSNESLSIYPPDNFARSLRNRAEDVLVAVAVLGLTATVSDGEPSPKEIDLFMRSFRKRFLVSIKQTRRVVGAAVRIITTQPANVLVQSACDTLNDHLDTGQKLELFNGLVEILLSDGQVHEGEEYYLDYIADRLGVTAVINELVEESFG